MSKYLLIILISTCSFFLSAQNLPDGFGKEKLNFSFEQPAGMTFDENGRMYVWEKKGKVFIIENNVLRQEPLVDVSDEVFDRWDIGMLGFALDPDFISNGFIYLYFPVDPYHLLHADDPNYDPSESWYGKASIGRIVRYQADVNDNLNSILPNSRKVLIGETIDSGIPVLYTSHGTGALAFGTDGTLLVSSGDGSTWQGAYVGSGPPYFEEYVENAMSLGIIRPEEEKGSFRSQIVNCMSGKILRIDPETGDGIPSNPFYESPNPRSAQSRVWTLGMRNPYRFHLREGSGSVDPADGLPGVLYIADVGEAGWEELNVIGDGGKNCGWPLYEGIDKIPVYYDQITENLDAPNPMFDTNCNQEYYNFQDLIQQPQAPLNPPFLNPCDSDMEINVPSFYHHPPALAWKHNEPLAVYPDFNNNGEMASVSIDVPESKIEGEGFIGRAGVTGGFYKGEQFPEVYQDKFFIADYVSGWIKYMEFDLNDELIQVESFYQGEGEFISHLEISPQDGCLYYIEYSNSDIFKICYGSNVPPVAVASADVYFGTSPLTVQFSGGESYDPQGTPLTYHWDFGDGTSSTDPNPEHIFSTNNNMPTPFEVALTVTDSLGATGTETLIISLNNTPPIVEITSIEDGTLYPMEGNTYWDLKANVSDAEHEEDDLIYEWQSFLHHDTHAHPNPPVNETETQMVIEPAGCDGHIYYYRFQLTVTDGAGLSASDEVSIYPDCAPPFVEFLSFNALSNGEEVICTWQTASEEQLKEFYIQKSKDGDFWTTMETIQPKNDQQILTEYTYTDTQPFAGKSYYRLAMINEGGLAVFSPEREVFFVEFDKIYLYPNPASDFMNIIFKNLNQRAEMILYDYTGRILGSRFFEGEGNVARSFSLQGLEAGVYFYKIKNGEESYTGRIVVAK